MRTYAYLRASTQEQNVNRAHKELETFANQYNSTISAWFIEHESGATLQRPELFRLLEAGNTYRDIVDALECSKGTTASVSRTRKTTPY